MRYLRFQLIIIILFIKALLKKIKTLRLVHVVRENQEAKTFLKKVMALAYLPEQMIEEEFTSLKNALTPAMRRSFAGFFAYYTRQWLTIVKPAGFSVYGLSRRTNNVIESYNSVLADKLGQHPSSWQFIGQRYFKSLVIFIFLELNSCASNTIAHYTFYFQ
jgi:hypothetical protein